MSPLMTASLFFWLWPALILLLAIAISWFLARALRRIRDTRLSRLRRIQPAAVPVSSDAPMEDVSGQAKRVARDSVQKRFTIISRGMVVVLLGLGILVAIFPFLGFMPKTLLSILTAVGAAVVGIAARPFVENVFAGIVLSLSQQVRLGDTVLVDDKYGTVEDISMTHTVIKVWDWRRYIVPNSAMLSKEVENYSHRDHFLWATVVFSVDYREDLEVIEALAIEVAKGSEHFHAEEDPQFWVWDLAADRITCWLAAWATSPQNAWCLKADLRNRLARTFRDRGIRTHRQHLDLSDMPGQAPVMPSPTP